MIPSKIKYVILAFTAAILPLFSHAADEMKFKFGKPSMEEMSMTVYDKDTTAAAIVLYKSCNLDYNVSSSSLRMYYRVNVRIKILKDSGKEYADFSIPYIAMEDDLERTEVFNSLKVTTSNLEDGKIKQIAMPMSMVSDERVNKQYMVRKFSAPGVKAGSVIDYQYELFSPITYHIHEWYMQEEIPVAYSFCKWEIPTLYNFNVEATNRQNVTGAITQGRLMVDKQGGSFAEEAKYYITNIYTVSAVDMEAIKDDDYVWNTDDYRAKMAGELCSTSFPGLGYQEYRKTWEQVDDEILSSESIGKRLNTKSKLVDENLLQRINGISSIREKVLALHRVLKENVAWNGNYGLVAEPQNEILKKRSGKSSDLNMLFINMLRTAGIQAYPVFLSTHRNGRMRQTFPTIESLNDMIVAVEEGGSFFYFDASEALGGINMLRSNVCVDKARMMGKGIESQWIDLTPYAKVTVQSKTEMTIADDGSVTGTCSNIMKDGAALEFKSNYHNAKDSIEFITKIGNENGIDITDNSISGHNDYGNAAMLSYSFGKAGNDSGDHLYISPYIIKPMGASPFKDAERMLPVEMPAKMQKRYVYSITIPDSYVVEELPQNINIATEDKTLSVRIALTQKENRIEVLFNFSNTKLIYEPDEYPTLKKIYDIAANKMNDLIVLRKK